MPARPSFRIVPLPRELVDRVRRTMTDDFGHQLHLTKSTDTNPCRFTLRQIPAGEESILMSYSPFLKDHPYREVGPVFIRRHGDIGYEEIHHWPPEIDPTKRVFRAYNTAEEIVDARVGAADPAAQIADLFANPAIDSIHVRSLTHGCFTFKILRA